MFTLFKLLFRKEIEAYDEAVINAQLEAASKIREIQKQANIKAEQYELVKRAFSDFPGGKILGLEKNKASEEVFVFVELHQSSLDLYLYGESYKVINHHPRIYCTIKEDQSYKEDYFPPDKYIHIEDVLVEDLDHGNGSILMRYLIREAKELGAKCIRGGLSSIDKGHFNRSEHFYKKHGFEVSFNEDRSSGQIILAL